MALTLSTFVYPVKTLAQARYCAGMGVEIIQFDIAENGISLEEAVSIAGWLSGIKIAVPSHLLGDTDEWLKPDYVYFSSPTEVTPTTKGILLAFSSPDIEEINAQLSQWEDQIEFLVVPFQPHWVEPETNPMLLELLNHPRLMLSFQSITEVDDVLRLGQKPRAMAIPTQQMPETESRSILELFEDMD